MADPVTCGESGSSTGGRPVGPDLLHDRSSVYDPEPGFYCCLDPRCDNHDPGQVFNGGRGYPHVIYVVTD